jgi:HK97 family phage portal protein
MKIALKERWNNFKSAMRSERGTGGYNSNPFFGQSLMAALFGVFSGTSINYAQEVGELTQSRLIMSAVNFLGRSLPEAPLEVFKPKPDGTKKLLPEHPLLALFARPNKYYTGDLLWKSFGLSWIIAGNVYFYKVRNRLGEVIELWYLPHHLIEPRWRNENSFIDYYAYLVDGIEYELDPKDVIHFRNGIDPHNTRMGLSDIASALREIYTDNEASNFSALLMKNNGVGPFAISPDGQLNLQEKDAKRMQDAFMRRTSGDERGKPFISGSSFKVVKTGFSPDELDLSKLRHLPEETIASLTGIPAIVLQFGAGLERSTYSNYSEAKESAYEGVVVPLWRYIQAELTHQLLSDFDRSEKLVVKFKTAEVRILQDDQTKLFTRVGLAYRNGLMLRSEGRSMLGLTTKPEDEVYFVEPKKEEKPKDDPVPAA